MPYFNNLEDDEKELGEGQQIATGEQTLGGGAAAAPKPVNANSQKGSGQFADLSEYLRVNQPQEFGTKLAGKVGEDVTKAGEAITGAGEEFKSRADQSTVQKDSSLIDEATGEGAADFAQDENKVKEFEKQRDANYQGPTSFSDASDIYNQSVGAAQTATGKAKAASSEGGRFALLDNYFGRDNYTSGQKSLDNLLVQNDQNARDAFEQVQQNADLVSAQQKTVEGNSNVYGSQAKATTAAARSAARDALGIDDAGNLVDGKGALGGLRKSVDDAVSSRRSKYDADVAAVEQALASKDISNLTPEQRAIFGELSSDSNLFNLDLNDYFSKSADPNTSITRYTTADQNQARRLSALEKLSGRSDNYLNPDEVKNNTSDPLFDFDEAKFTTDQSNTRKAMESEFNDYKPFNLPTYPTPAEDGDLAHAADYMQKLSKYTGLNIWKPDMGLNESIYAINEAINNTPASARDHWVPFLQEQKAKLEQKASALTKKYNSSNTWKTK